MNVTYAGRYKNNIGQLLLHYNKPEFKIMYHNLNLLFRWKIQNMKRGLLKNNTWYVSSNNTCILGFT